MLFRRSFESTTGHPRQRASRAFGHAVLVAALVLFSREAAAQFTVESLEQHFRLGRDSLTQVIEIRSESDTAQQLRIQLKDWIRDSLGQNTYGELGSLAGSCGARIQAFPLSIQLAPRGREFVRVAYETTGAQDPGCWAILLLEAVKPPSTTRTQGAAVSLTVLTGVKLYYHAAVEDDDGEIDLADVEMSWERTRVSETRVDSTQVRDVVVRFVNRGTSHLRVKSTVEIRSENAQLLHELRGPESYITPGAFRDVLVRVPTTLAAGRYVAIALLDYGGAEIKAAQVEFEIP